MEWLSCDSENPGFQILTDEEIIEDLNSNEREDKEETETGDVCQVPSHAEAFEPLDVAVDKCGSDIMEDDDILENQHRDVTRQEEAETIMENEKRICEKRMRPNSEDTGEDDEFITVGRKRIARSFSKKQNSPGPDECGNEILTQFEDKIVVCVTGVEEEEIKDNLVSESEIVSIRRLKRMNYSGKWINSETIRICFKESTLPDYVNSYGCRFKVDPYMFPVTQCSGC
ncbi:uncharacterized protein LOC124542618 [Vanessa cardui]|uniref:uncharacterized protein LOC124542618 n=1 Tax=Vanessa cardui TaxID=171605 RepID=UPI001F148E2F|nr:uncharacterized protein LOC124542618 [Vanessa cardui]